MPELTNRKLRTEELTIAFGGVTALRNVSVEIGRGDTVGIIGPNGAGKTSLLNSLNGFYKPLSGRVLYGEHDLTQMRPHDIAKLGISRTFQSMELVQEGTVLENVLLGRHVHMDHGPLAGAIFWGAARREEVEHRTKAEEVIEFLEIELCVGGTSPPCPPGSRS